MEEENKEDDNTTEIRRKKRVIKYSDGQGEKTLEKLDNINKTVWEHSLEFAIDPLFKKTMQKLDEGTDKNYYLSRIGINSNLEVVIDSNRQAFEERAGTSDCAMNESEPAGYLETCLKNGF